MNEKQGKAQQERERERAEANYTAWSSRLLLEYVLDSRQKIELKKLKKEKIKRKDRIGEPWRAGSVDRSMHNRWTGFPLVCPAIPLEV